MDNSLKGLILAGGVIITCIVVGLGFYISREAKNTSSGGISQITKLSSEFQDVSKTMYDGIKVSGREVCDTIDKCKEELEKGEFKIVVFTGKKNSTNGGVLYNKENSTSSEARSIVSEKYINPNANFLGSITSDENGVITTLTFQQQ